MVGTWDLEMAGVESGAGLGKKQPGTGKSDPDSARSRGCNPSKNYKFPNYKVPASPFSPGSFHLGTQWAQGQPSSFWHCDIRSITRLGPRTGFVCPLLALLSSATPLSAP